ncbi:MAG: class B sortase [Oscillospiraceae bacterium]|nr:class B sortase [Oscillospiraceae bacterium]
MKFRKFLFNLLLLILAAIFVISGYQVVTYFLNSKEQRELYSDLASIVEDAKENTPTPNKSEKDEPANTDEPDAPTAEPTILPEYQELYTINSDMVGWLKIEDTNINYPVMQTPESTDYYLHHNFFKQDNPGGCLYAREQCDINAPSDNITIYGHHMKDGSMLANLDYYNDQEFYETHSEVTFDTLYEHHTYQIFAVFKTSASVNEGFRYHHFVDADDQEDFDEFIATCKALSFYDTGITPEYGDKIICLSTCEYTQQNGRLVVAAVRIE